MTLSHGPTETDKAEKPEELRARNLAEELKETSRRLPGGIARFNEISWRPKNTKGEEGLVQFLEFINIGVSPNTTILEELHRDLEDHKHSNDPKDLIFQMQLTLVNDISQRIENNKKAGKSASTSAKTAESESSIFDKIENKKVARFAKETTKNIFATIKNIIRQIHNAVRAIVGLKRPTLKQKKSPHVPAWTSASTEAKNAQPRSPPQEKNHLSEISVVPKAMEKSHNFSEAARSDILPATPAISTVSPTTTPLHFESEASAGFSKNIAAANDTGFQLPEDSSEEPEIRASTLDHSIENSFSGSLANDVHTPATEAREAPGASVHVLDPSKKRKLSIPKKSPPKGISGHQSPSALSDLRDVA